MSPRRLSDEEMDEIAARAADRVLASEEFRALVRRSGRSPGRVASDAATTAARAAERAVRRRADAVARQTARLTEEQQRAVRLVELWVAGVPREQIAGELGLTRQGFDVEVERLRREGEERLTYRPGID